METHSRYIFLFWFEVLAISIRENKTIQGILVKGREIKLKLKADDLTVLLRNEQHFINFLMLSRILENAQAYFTF